MTAVIYKFERPGEDDSVDETERLFSALERYTSAELLELLYTGEEPGFFELMRGIFMLSDESRSILQNFLTEMPAQTITVSIDPKGRCILTRGIGEQWAKPVKGIAG
jgi:predicted flavoprotein YhiN